MTFRYYPSNLFLLEFFNRNFLKENSWHQKKSFWRVDFHKAAYNCEKTSFDTENNSHALIIFHVEKNELKDLDPKVDFWVKIFLHDHLLVLEDLKGQNIHES